MHLYCFAPFFHNFFLPDQMESDGQMKSGGNLPGTTGNHSRDSTNANSTNITAGSLFGNLIAHLANLSTVQPQSYDGLATFMSALTGQTFQVVCNPSSSGRNPSTSGEMHPINHNMTTTNVNVPTLPAMDL
jgi:hypothetical protein